MFVVVCCCCVLMFVDSLLVFGVTVCCGRAVGGGCGVRCCLLVCLLCVSYCVLCVVVCYSYLLLLCVVVVCWYVLSCVVVCLLYVCRCCVLLVCVVSEGCDSVLLLSFAGVVRSCCSLLIGDVCCMLFVVCKCLSPLADVYLVLFVVVDCCCSVLSVLDYGCRCLKRFVVVWCVVVAV